MFDVGFVDYCLCDITTLLDTIQHTTSANDIACRSYNWGLLKTITFFWPIIYELLTFEIPLTILYGVYRESSTKIFYFFLFNIISNCFFKYFLYAPMEQLRHFKLKKKYFLDLCNYTRVIFILHEKSKMTIV